MNLFRCEVLRARLTEDACASRHALASGKRPWRGPVTLDLEASVTYSPCRACEEGALRWKKKKCSDPR